MRGSIAVATLWACFSGIALGAGQIEGIQQAVLIWFVFVVICGLFLQTDSGEAISTAVKRAAIPASFITSVILGLLLVQVLLADLRDYEGKGHERVHMFGRTFPANAIADNWDFILVFAVMFLGASITGIALASIGQVELIRYLKNISIAGPDEIDRLNKIVRAVIVLVGSVFLLLSIFA